MDLENATPEQMASEMTRRNLDFALIVVEDEDANVYSPPHVSGKGNRLSNGLFEMVRDFICFCEQGP